ncbi:hypothetical protein CL689_00570 [Candidatus Saccharibacteria bacterium]|nr:hypothetical protein [Candidatus Saccharibacteria bacterium]MBQ68543.1 hypothetical protein [Candidatus Saccharibacteria bacterium]|tara:strand:- start:337 stop:1125 length:789 start_codon:yes stop_codon:yes gene_type:complete
MKRRWDAGLTVVELVVAIVVVGILIVIGVYSYGQIQRQAAEKAVISDLQQASALMLQGSIRDRGTYPTSIPQDMKHTEGVELEVAESGVRSYYEGLSPVQNGVLFAQICEDLISEGVGRGVNQGGDSEDYISGCGNWNDDSMQITGWNTQRYDTPVHRDTLENYAQSFTTNDAWNKAAHEATVSTFYGELIERFESSGGEFPIITFWDYWANSGNGGIMREELPTAIERPYFCIDAVHTRYDDLRWYITSSQKVYQGSCESA